MKILQKSFILILWTSYTLLTTCAGTDILVERTWFLKKNCPLKTMFSLHFVNLKNFLVSSFLKHFYQTISAKHLDSVKMGVLSSFNGKPFPQIF